MDVALYHTDCSCTFCHRRNRIFTTAPTTSEIQQTARAALDRNRNSNKNICTTIRRNVKTKTCGGVLSGQPERYTNTCAKKAGPQAYGMETNCGLDTRLEYRTRTDANECFTYYTQIHSFESTTLPRRSRTETVVGGKHVCHVAVAAKRSQFE